MRGFESLSPGDRELILFYYFSFFFMVREKELPVQKSIFKSTYIRLQLPSGEAISAPPLSATLGQVQINSSDFCKAFNSFSTQFYDQGVLVNVDLFKKPDNTYYFIIRGVSLPFLIFQISNDQKFVPIEILYDAFFFKAQTEGIQLNFSSAKLFFGALRSINFRIIFLDSYV
jgi:hypothetical protein